MTRRAAKPVTPAAPDPSLLGDGAVEQARRACNATWDVLAKHVPDAAAELVAQARAIGMGWYGPQLVVNDAGDAVTTAEAAEILRCSRGQIRRWASTPHPYAEDDSVMLLRRHGTRGASTTYLVADLWEAKRTYKKGVAERRLAKRKIEPGW